MRTTVDLPDDLHRTVSSLARQRGQTLSQVVSDYVRRGMGYGSPLTVRTDEETGFPVVHTGVRVTMEDVQALDDE